MSSSNKERSAFERVGFIGLGGMGGAMAKNLAEWLKSESYPPLTVWNRTVSKSEPFKAQGCDVASSVEDLGTECKVVIVSLANDTAAREVYDILFRVANTKEESTIFLECSTLYPDFVAELERKAKESKGSLFAATPVFGPVPMAMNATLCACLSGSTEARTLARKFMVPSMCSRSIDVGEDVKKAAGLKLVGNSLVLGIIEILSEALTLSEKIGVGTDLVNDFVKSFLPAPSMIGYCEKISNNEFDSTMGFAITGGMKDASHIKSLATQYACPMPTIDLAFQHLQTSKALGAAAQTPELDWSSLVVALRLNAGLEPFSGVKGGSPLDIKGIDKVNGSGK